MPQYFSRSTVHGAIARTTFFSPEGRRVEELDTRELPQRVQEELMAVGFGAAKPSASSTEEAMRLYDEFVAALRAGEWTAERAAPDTGPSVLVLAIERYESRHPEAQKHSREEIEATVGGLSPAQKRQLHGSAELAPHIRDIEIERAREKARTAKAGPSLLGDLFGTSTPHREAAE